MYLAFTYCVQPFLLLRFAWGIWSRRQFFLFRRYGGRRLNIFAPLTERLFSRARRTAAGDVRTISATTHTLPLLAPSLPANSSVYPETSPFITVHITVSSSFLRIHSECFESFMVRHVLHSFNSLCKVSLNIL